MFYTIREDVVKTNFALTSTFLKFELMIFTTNFLAYIANVLR